MNKSALTIIGFILFVLGMLSIVLSLVGVQFAFLTWIDAPGRLFGFLIRILMIVVGLTIVVISKSDFSGEKGI